MRMGKLKVGFEQRRGLFMTIGDENGFTRESINWTQLHMLRRCEVPGLLPIENEELDGVITFRFDLNGYRMLGETLRIVKWTMSDFMNALCRLAEVLEDCRLYLLDADRILLEDEFIFLGGEGQDIRLTYLPVNTAHRSADTLERLVVRWMMGVSAEERPRFICTASPPRKSSDISSPPSTMPNALSRPMKATMIAAKP